MRVWHNNCNVVICLVVGFFITTTTVFIPTTTTTTTTTTFTKTASSNVVECFVAQPHRGASRFFLDSANEQEWEHLLCTGMFHGVTTNPLVLQQVNQPCTIENLHRMAHVALQSVNEFVCQTWGNTMEEMYDNGMALTQPDRHRIVVKVPITLTGVQVATKLIQSGCRVCLTSVFDHRQALTAVAIGADYLAPCLGIMNDIGKDGVQECQKMLDIVQGLEGKTRVMVACVRDVQVMAQLAAASSSSTTNTRTRTFSRRRRCRPPAGMNTCSFSPAIARELFLEPRTDELAAELEDHVALSADAASDATRSTTRATVVDAPATSTNDAARATVTTTRATVVETSVSSFSSSSSSSNSTSLLLTTTTNSSNNNHSNNGCSNNGNGNLCQNNNNNNSDNHHHHPVPKPKKTTITTTFCARLAASCPRNRHRTNTVQNNNHNNNGHPQPPSQPHQHSHHHQDQCCDKEHKEEVVPL